jgi:hypothetical protein
MFFAALMSRSFRARQEGHVQCLVDRLSWASTCPHAEQVFELGYQRPITTSSRPYRPHLYSSWRRNSPQPQSEIARARWRLRIMFAAPSLRLGWLVVPPRLLDAVTAELAAGPSALDQLTLAEFITSGGYDRQIRRARLAYRSRRDRLAAALRRQGLRVTGIAAGMHAVLELPRTSLEHAALTGASEHGVAIDGLGHYRAGGASPGDDGHQARAGLVIGYGRPPEHAYTTALARLCAVLADLR